MKNFFMTLIRNNAGMSLVEVVVAAGVMGAVSLGVMKLTDTSQRQTIVSNQNFDFDNYARDLKTRLNEKGTCDSLITETSPGSGQLTLDTSSIASELRYNASLKESKIILPPRNAQIEVLPLNIFLTFKRGESESSGHTVRRVLVNCLFDAAGAFQGCANYLTQAEKNAFKLSCELMGGSLVDDTSLDPPYRCDLAGLDQNTKVTKDLMKKFCIEKINPSTADAYVGDFCQDIDLGDSKLIIGQNINENKIALQGNARTTYYQQNCSAPNTFIQSINVNGSVNCLELKYCVTGENCPGD